MNSLEKVKYIDKTLSFYFEGDFLAHVEKYGIGQNELSVWHLKAVVFDELVRTLKFNELNTEVFELVEEAVADYSASLFLGVDEKVDVNDIGLDLDGRRIEFLQVIILIPELIEKHKDLVSGYFSG